LSRGGGLSRWFGSPGRWAALTTAVVAALATVSLVVEGTPASAVVPASPAPAGPDVSGPATASDPVSAMVQARSQGRVVEDVSQRTVESSTFALPDGIWATGAGSGPVWVPRIDRTGGDVDTHPSARELLAAMELTTLPVVTTGTHWWSGYRPERIVRAMTPTSAH
jgi:hypothetical protein